jgi:hypothetical protein
MGKENDILSQRTTDLQEYRHFRAWELHLHGWKQQEITAALGVA